MNVSWRHCAGKVSAFWLKPDREDVQKWDVSDKRYEFAMRWWRWLIASIPAMLNSALLLCNTTHTVCTISRDCQDVANSSSPECIRTSDSALPIGSCFSA